MHSSIYKLRQQQHLIVIALETPRILLIFYYDEPFYLGSEFDIPNANSCVQGIY